MCKAEDAEDSIRKGRGKGDVGRRQRLKGGNSRRELKDRGDRREGGVEDKRRKKRKRRVCRSRGSSVTPEFTRASYSPCLLQHALQVCNLIKEGNENVTR